MCVGGGDFSLNIKRISESSEQEHRLQILGVRMNEILRHLVCIPRELKTFPGKQQGSVDSRVGCLPGRAAHSGILEATYSSHLLSNLLGRGLCSVLQGDPRQQRTAGPGRCTGHRVRWP